MILKKNDLQTLTRIIPFLTKYKTSFFIYLLLTLIVMLLSSIQPLLFGRIVDQISYGNLSLIMTILGVVALIALVGIVLKFIKFKTSLKMSNNIEMDVKNNLFEKVLFLTMNEFSKIRSGEFIEKLEQDVKVFSTILTKDLINIVLDIGTLIVIGIIMLKINWLMTIILLITFPLSILIFNYFAKYTRNESIKYKEATDNFLSYLHEIFSGFQVIKIFRIEDNRILKFRNYLKEIYQIKYKYNTLSATSGNLSEFISTIGYLIVLGVGIFQIIENKLTIGGLVAFNTYSSLFSNSLFKVSQLNINLQNTLVSLTRVFDLMDRYEKPQEVYDEDFYKDTFNNDIHLRNIAFNYLINEQKILNNISFDIPQNKITAIIGATGAGKSTILNLLMGLYHHYNGDIYVGKVNYKEIPQKIIYRDCVLITQESFIFSASIKENITLANNNVSEEEVIRACKVVDIHEYISKLPMGYETVIGKNGVELSAGLKQRLSIARALLKRSKVYLFDEITSFQDSLSEKTIIEVINHLSEEATVVIISHKLSTLHNLCVENVILIEDGLALQKGSVGI